MRKLLIIPAVVFISPWIHRLAYENMLLAVPTINHSEAHGWIIAMSIIVVFGIFLTEITS